MKQTLVLLLFIPQLIFSEDIYFKVIETTPYWEDINFPRPSNISGEILQGSTVKGYRGVQKSSIEGVYENILFQEIFYNNSNRGVLVYADSLIPLGTQDLFDNNILYNPNKPLIFSFFINALLAKDRELIYLHDELAWDDYLAYYTEHFTLDGQDAGSWWNNEGVFENLIITQTTFKFYSTVKSNIHLLIKSIKKIEEGYIVVVKEGVFFYDINGWKWSKPEEHKLFTILLVPDGDYIDLYLGNKEELMDTFVFVNKELTTQINNLIRGYPIDLTRITLPQRAPKQLNVGEEYRALEDLQFWNEPDMSGEIITTMEQGSKVTILEIGASAVIEGVTTPLVQVKTSGGETGWCFGLYLREIRHELTQEEFEEIVKNIKTTQINDEKIINQDNSTMPSSETVEKKSVNWSIFGIGFIVLSAGGATVFIVKRKKQRAN
jgi:hypothetical protein